MDSYAKQTTSIDGRPGSLLILIQNKKNRKEMASTTIARRGFAGLYFLSIDGREEAGERRASLDAFHLQAPSRLGFEWRFHQISVSKILLIANLIFRKKLFAYLLSALSKNSF